LQKIPLNLARPGMVLEKPLLRDNGQVLLGPGTKLTDSTLQRLERMEVQWVTVQGNPVKIEGQGQGSYHDRIKALDSLFRQHQEDPWMMKIKKFFRGYFKRKAMQEGSAPGPDSDTQ